MDLAEGVAIYAAVVSTGAAVQGWRMWRRVPNPVLKLKNPVGQLDRDGLVEITCIAANRSPFPVGLDKGYVEWWVEPSVERFPEFLPSSVAQVITTELENEKTGRRVTTIRAIAGPGRVEVRETAAAGTPATGPLMPDPNAEERLLSVRYRMRSDLSPAADEVIYPTLIPQGHGVRLSATVEMKLLPPQEPVDLLVTTNEGGHFSAKVESPMAVWSRRGRVQTVAVSLKKRPFYRRALRRSE
jgi:hypothetical protein